MSRRIVFTTHAREKTELLKVPFKKAVWMAYNSLKVKAPHPKMKMEKYKDADADVFYKAFGPYGFTMLNTNDKHNGEEITLVITMYLLGNN